MSEYARCEDTFVMDGSGITTEFRSIVHGLRHHGIQRRRARIVEIDTRGAEEHSV